MATKVAKVVVDVEPGPVLRCGLDLLDYACALKDVFPEPSEIQAEIISLSDGLRELIQQELDKTFGCQRPPRTDALTARRPNHGG